MKKLVAYVFATSLLLAACKKKEDVEISPNKSSDSGILKGKVVSANGTYPINKANVYIDYKGEVYMTHTDSEGNFELNAPLGHQLLYITTGNGQKFRSTIEVDVAPGQVTSVAGGSVQLAQVGKLAYVYGQYDDIQTIVYDSLGYNIDQLMLADLANLPLMQTYDAIFFNCGSDYKNIGGLEYNNIKTYIRDGGSVYASDWAVGYLTGLDTNFMSPMMPAPSHEGLANHDHHSASRSCAPRLGGFLPTSVLCSEKNGSSGLLPNNAIVATDIQALLGKNTIDIEYDLGAWEVIDNVGPEFDILIQDNVAGNGPLAIRSNVSLLSYLGSSGSSSGGGSTGGFVTICHIPPGNPSNPQTITIATSALPAHLAHGCSVGACNGDGQLLYTTFHNHPQGQVSPDVQDILEYFILNL